MKIYTGYNQTETATDQNSEHDPDGLPDFDDVNAEVLAEKGATMRDSDLQKTEIIERMNSWRIHKGTLSDGSFVYSVVNSHDNTLEIAAGDKDGAFKLLRALCAYSID